jgi:copper(I)-binding protein
MKNLLLASALFIATISPAYACDMSFEITNAWVKPSLQGKDATAAFFNLKNTTGKTIKLTDVSSPAGIGAIHNTTTENGALKMRQITEIAIPAGETVSFKPKSLHIMIERLKKPLKEGDKVKLSMYFDNNETVNVELPVAAAATVGRVEPIGHH